MSNFRVIKDRARSRLNRRMRAESFCYPDGPGSAYSTVRLRVHSKDEARGDLAGAGSAYAERREPVPKLIFLAKEHDPRRGSVYAIGPEEAYRADTVDPRDGITVTVTAVRLSKKEAADYEYPGR